MIGSPARKLLIPRRSIISTKFEFSETVNRSIYYTVCKVLLGRPELQRGHGAADPRPGQAGLAGRRGLQILRRTVPGWIVSDPVLCNTTIYFLLVSSSPFLSRCVPADVTSQAGSLFSGTGAQSLAEDLVRDFQNCSAELVSAESLLWRVVPRGAGPDGPGGAGTLHPHHGALPLPRRHHRLRHHRGRRGGSDLPWCGVRVVTCY